MSNYAKCRLAWESGADKKSISATSYDGNMTPAKLLTTQIQEKWRSSNANQQILTGNFGELLVVGYFLLYAHNLSVNSTIRFILSINADYSNPVIDQTFDGVESTYGLGELLGLYLGGYSMDNFFTKYTIKWFSPVMGQYWKVIITDTTNPDGYIQAGRMKFGEYFEGVYNMSWGYASDLKSNSKVLISESLARFARTKPQQRTFTFDFNYIDRIEELIIVRMLSATDLSKDILFSAYPETGTTEEQLHTALCFIENWKKRTRYSVPYRDTGLTLVEAI